MANRISQQALLEKLKEKVYNALTEERVDSDTGELLQIHPRDLAALGNLILSMQKREDELQDKMGNQEKIVAFPALPPGPGLKALG
jgi:hypothetical protein